MQAMMSQWPKTGCPIQWHYVKTLAKEEYTTLKMTPAQDQDTLRNSAVTQKMTSP